MSDDVKLVFTGDSGSAEKALANLERKYDALESRLKRVARTSKEGGREAEAQFAELNRVLTTGAGLAAGFAAGFIDIRREAQAAAHEAGKTVDAMTKAFRVQSGLRGLASKQAEEAVAKISIANAVKPEVGFDIATQLVSSGVNVKTATGGGLDAVQDIMAATNAAKPGFDASGLSNALVSYLNSQGQEANEQSLRKLGVASHAAFKTGNFQVDDLTEMAKVGSAITALSTPEQISNYTVLKDAGFSKSEAATSMRNIVGRLQTAEASQEKVQALAKIGLSPADVDLVGESFRDATTRVTQGLQTIPEAQRAGVLKKLFDEQGVAAFKTLAAGQEKAERYRGAMMDEQAFLADVQEGQSGRNAAEIRLKGQQLMRRSKEDNMADLAITAYDEQLAAEGVPAWRRAIKTGDVPGPLGAITSYLPIGAKGLMNYGMDPKSAIMASGDTMAVTPGGPMGLQLTANNDLEGTGGTSARAILRLEEALNKNTDATERAAKQPMIDRNAQVE